jgi:hypothetical protein
MVNEMTSYKGLAAAKPIVLQYIDKEISSDAYDISDATAKANQNKITSDLTDISEPISSNKTLFNLETDEQNHSASDSSETSIKTNLYMVTPSRSDSSDISDVTPDNMKMSANPTIDNQNHHVSDVYDISDANADMNYDLNRGSRNIYRLGRSDTWACENCKQRGDGHFMKEHLCKGEKK